jgi:hypothetical protein
MILKEKLQLKYYEKLIKMLRKRKKKKKLKK